ncbi:hypothetical protein [Rhizobium leguminosarum]
MVDLPSWTWSDAFSIAASLAAIVALPYAAYQVRRARINSSATAAAMIFTNVRSRIDELATQKDEDGLYESTVALLNEIELSCAFYLDGQFGGYSGKLARAFLQDILGSIERNERLLNYVQRAVHKPDTFECVRKFCSKHKKGWSGLKQTSSRTSPRH